MSLSKLLTLFLAASGGFGADNLTQTVVFRSGEEGYHTYRIPALILTKKGTLLAFCEGRKNSARDTGDIDLLVKRSTDRGRTWSRAQVIADFGENTIGNPTPVVELRSGAILLLLTSNLGRDTEKQIVEGTSTGTRTVWMTRSMDDGLTWAPPEDITASVKREDWTWYATGPGNGIQTASGRLVIPCDHIRRGAKTMHSHVIYSDDRGRTWKIGGVAGEKTNESAVVELRGGALLLNMRNHIGQHRRAIAYSQDGGLTWTDPVLDPVLVDPVCQASLIRAAAPGKKSNGRLLFSNPADVTRVRMTVRLSEDDGKTWPYARLIHEGPSAYSSLAILPGGNVGLLYESGDKTPYERITFARFPVAWIKGR